MAEEFQKVRQTTVRDGNTVQTTKRVENTETEAEEVEHKQNVSVRVIWYITGILLALLAFRFILALLGANPTNSFANFIYTTSGAFVAPFFGLFSYDAVTGESRFESFTLVAMGVYALIAYGISKLVTINQR